MDTLLHRFSELIKGSIEGFDRLVFKGALKPISFALGMQAFLKSLLHHAIMTGTCERVLKYMGRPVMKDGQSHPLANPDLLTKVSAWYDGMRIRHFVDNNSVKFYNEQNVLRSETTLNNPKKYLVRRHKENADKSGEKNA